MADDRPLPKRREFDIETDEGLEAFIHDLETRRPVPEGLRYPQTDEEYERMLDEVDAEARERGTVPLEKVEAWVRSWGSANELPRPEPECEEASRREPFETSRVSEPISRLTGRGPQTACSSAC
jgi:hypothetical protein